MRPGKSQQPFLPWTSGDDTGNTALSSDVTIWTSVNTHTRSSPGQIHLTPLGLTISPSPACPSAESYAAQGKDRSDTGDVLKELPPRRSGYVFRG